MHIVEHNKPYFTSSGRPLVERLEPIARGFSADGAVEIIVHRDRIIFSWASVETETPSTIGAEW